MLIANPDRSNLKGTPVLGVLAAALALAGCDVHRDSGQLMEQTRQLEPFDAIDMEGAARLEITVGKPRSVVLQGRETVLGRVETTVRGGTLYIQSKPRDWFISEGRPRVTLRIDIEQLESLRLEGGNDVRLSGFSGGRAQIRVAGATRMKADGRLDELTVRMAGAGHADLSNLIASQASVTLDGVGSVIVHPTDTLEATMNGVGAILYIGSPREVNTRMNGLGTIGRHEPKDSAAPDSAPQVDPETRQPDHDDPGRRERKPPVQVI